MGEELWRNATFERCLLGKKSFNLSLIVETMRECSRDLHLLQFFSAARGSQNKNNKKIKESKGNLFQQENKKYLVNEAILNLEETQNVDRYVIDFGKTRHQGKGKNQAATTQTKENFSWRRLLLFEPSLFPLTLSPVSLCVTAYTLAVRELF